MSPAAVLERSGAGHGSLYHHFKGKKDLATRVLVDVEADLSRGAARVLDDPDATPLQRIEAWLMAPREPLKGCRLGRLAQEASVASDRELRQPIARYFKQVRVKLERNVARAQRDGSLAADVEPGAVASLLIATVQGGYVLSRGCRDGKRLDEACRAALALLRGFARAGS